MRRLFRDVLTLLTPVERRKFYALMALTTVTGLIEASSVASILPLLALLSDPGIVEGGGRLARIYDWWGGEDLQGFRIACAVAVFLVVTLGLMLKAATAYATVRFATMRGYTLSSRILEGYLRQPYEWFLQQTGSRLQQTILSEVAQFVQQVMQPLMRFLASVSVAVFMGLLLFLAEPVLALFAVAVLGVAYGGIYMGIRRLLQRLGKERLAANSVRFRITQEAVQGIKYTKLRGLEESYVRRFNMAASKMARIGALTTILGTMPRFVLEILAFGGMLTFILMTLLAGGGDIAAVVPTLGLIAFAGMRVLPAMQVLFSSLATLRSATAVTEKILEDFAMIETNSVSYKARRDGTSVPKPQREIVIDDIHYAYPEADRPALRGLEMRIPVRSTVGIVGGTGAGKTTTVDLLLGLLDIQKGALIVDGQRIDNAHVRGWQQNLGYVPQQIFLTRDSIASNIAFGIPPEEIDMAKVERAARIAALHDFVLQELPAGYETEVGDQGIRLSGGQRQRVGIARALYHDPEVLIFDEATSALDNITERAVMEAIDALGGEKTVIMIAHRLSTVKNCDAIFVLEHGQVAASGTYDELVEGSDTFRRMAAGV